MKQRHLCALLTFAAAFSLHSAAALAREGDDNGVHHENMGQIQAVTSANTNVNAGMTGNVRANTSANTAPTSSARVNASVNAEARQGNGTSSFDGLRQNLKTEIKNTRGNLVNNRKNLIDLAVRVFNVTVDRLTNIANRMDSRIAKLKDAGASTTAAASFVAAARVDLREAKAHEDAFLALDLSTEESVKTNMEKARTEAKGAQAELKSARENLRKGLEEMKKIEKTVRVEGSAEAR